MLFCFCVFFFFFNDTATTEIYTLSLHDALPLWGSRQYALLWRGPEPPAPSKPPDRKSTRLNSSHMSNSYAVFCLKKKKQSPSTSKSTRQKNAKWFCGLSMKI